MPLAMYRCDKAGYGETQRERMRQMLETNLPPLMSLSEHFRTFIKDPDLAKIVSLYILPLFTISAGNGKTPPAFCLLEGFPQGALAGKNVWMASSGNTAANVAQMLPWYDGGTLHAVVTKNTPPGKIGQLRLAGAEVIHPPDGVSTIAYAAERGSDPGCVCVDQYKNIQSVLAHQQYTWPHVGRELVRREKELSGVIIALGTTSSFVSAAVLRNRWPDMLMMGVACAGGEDVPGARDEERLAETGFCYRKFLQHPQAVGSGAPLFGYRRESYQMVEHLYAHGCSAGITTGMTVVAFMEMLNELSDSGDTKALDRLRNGQGKIVFVTLGMDAVATYTTDFANPGAFR